MKKEFLPSLVPQKPGVYLFRDRFGRVIYVGKAANLRKRLGNYFQPARVRVADAKTRSLINSIDDWTIEVVRNEEEALILESRLIKDYAPKYNILMRDDKRYPLLKINLDDPFPTFRKARFKKSDNALYFGPFPNGSALQQTLEFMLAYFQLRNCKDDHPSPDTMKRCLKRIVKDCSAPCLGKISVEDYRKRVDAALALLHGDTSSLVAELDERMMAAARDQRFEKAARFRDVKQNLLAVFGVKFRKFENPDLPADPVEEDAVGALADALGLPVRPEVIIGFDISNILGTLAVASLVCFRNGKPDRASYRRFRIKTVHQSDDFAMMKEVLHRHFSRLLAENRPLPDLVMVDGGKGQLSSAVEALVEMRCPALPVIGLAKREEEIFLPGREEPIVLSRHHAGLRILQALRDEAHRFAITYHRSLRQALLEKSQIDDIPGIGKIRKQQLLSAFGSVRRLKKADEEEIQRRVPGIGAAFSQKIVEFFKNQR